MKFLCGGGLVSSTEVSVKAVVSQLEGELDKGVGAELEVLQLVAAKGLELKGVGDVVVNQGLDIFPFGGEEE